MLTWECCEWDLYTEKEKQQTGECSSLGSLTKQLSVAIQIHSSADLYIISAH